MNLVLDLPQTVGAHLEAEAQKAGVTPAQLAAEALIRSFSPPPFDPEEQKRLNAPSIALLQRWLAEGEDATPEEIHQAEKETQELKRRLNAPRKSAGARLLFPEVEDAVEAA